MDKWTWRMNVAHWFHKVGYWFHTPECHDIIVRDAAGEQIFNIAFDGGFVASGPPEPYTLHCRHYADDDDLVGVEEEI